MEVENVQVYGSTSACKVHGNTVVCTAVHVVVQIKGCKYPKVSIAMITVLGWKIKIWIQYWHTLR